MGTDKQEEEDDGRVIADMSGIETPSLFAPFSGRKKRREGEVPKVKNDRPWEDSSLNQKERFWYAMGALKAALLIGLAYPCRTGGGDPFAVAALESPVG